MTIDDVLFFDTETTGIPDRSAKWDVDFNDYPRIVQIAWYTAKRPNRILSGRMVGKSRKKPLPSTELRPNTRWNTANRSYL